MNEIYEIFKGNFAKNENIIKTMDIDIERHKIGFANILNSMVPNFEIDENNTSIINNLFNYFIGNVQFCNENNLNLSKGILLCGGVGTGKSVIMQAIKLYTGKILMRNSFQSYHTSEVVDNVNVKGIDYLDKFNYTGLNPITCYIDDICSKKEKIKNFGTDISVIEELISIRYNVFCRQRRLTHFSTNIFPAEMNNYYDTRIIDRLIEMCNLISLNGISRRK